MSTKSTSYFETYDMPEQEALSASILNQSNLQYLHNLRTAIAHQKLHLKFDVANPQAFIQEEAYLKGQLDMITTLIDASEFSSSQLTAAASQLAVTEVSHDLNESPVARIFSDN